MTALTGTLLTLIANVEILGSRVSRLNGHNSVGQPDASPSSGAEIWTRKSVLSGLVPVLRFRRRADLLLIGVDVAVALSAAAAALGLRFEGESLPSSYESSYVASSAVLVVFWVLAARAAGLYRRAVFRPGHDLLRPSFEAAVACGVLLYMLDLMALGGDVSRGWIALAVLGLLVLGAVARVLLRRGRRALVPLGLALERYAIAGDDEAARRLHGDLTRAAGAPFTITALLRVGMPAEEVARQAAEARLDGVIVPAGRGPHEVAALARALHVCGVETLVAPAVGDVDLHVRGLSSFQGVPLLRVEAPVPRRKAVRQPPRRNLDEGVAILGTRGIPANYGGFETFAERLALYLVEQQIPTTVYCRSHYASAGASWRGIRLVTLPTVRGKYFDTVVHTILSAMHLILRTRVRDVILCNAANAPVLPLLRLAGCRVIMNVDGLEWRRGKWGIAGRSWYRLGEWLSVRFASVLVTDAEEVRTYYRVRYRTDSVMIPYGADLLERGLPLPSEVPVEPNRYILYVSRWERENNPVMVAGAHAKSGVDVPLVMLGASTYDPELDAEVRAAAGANVIMPGPLYGDGYRALQANALLYVHATEVGGTHPALIEAMAAGNICLALDTPENRETTHEVAVTFSDESILADLLKQLVALSPEDVQLARRRTRSCAELHYSWEVVGGEYMRLLVSDRPGMATEGQT